MLLKYGCTNISSFTEHQTSEFILKQLSVYNRLTTRNSQSFLRFLDCIVRQTDAYNNRRQSRRKSISRMISNLLGQSDKKNYWLYMQHRREISQNITL